jgi:hypothetical protein
MADSYVLKGTENEYLLVIRAEDEKAIYLVIDALLASRNEQIKEVAIELEKSLYDNRRDSSKTRSKNKSKTAASNDSKRRKAKDS